MVALPTLLLWVSIAATGDTTLVEFTAPGCQHCRVMDATVRRLQASGYAVQRVDAVQHRAVAERYGVTGTPTYVLMVNGQPVQKIEGASSYDRLVQVIESAAVPAAIESTDGDTRAAQRRAVQRRAAQRHAAQRRAIQRRAAQRHAAQRRRFVTGGGSTRR